MKIIRFILVVVIIFVKVVHKFITIQQKQQFPIDYKTHNRKIHTRIIQRFHASNSNENGGKEKRINLIDILPKY